MTVCVSPTFPPSLFQSDTRDLGLKSITSSSSSHLSNIPYRGELSSTVCVKLKGASVKISWGPTDNSSKTKYLSPSLVRIVCLHHHLTETLMIPLPNLCTSRHLIVGTPLRVPITHFELHTHSPWGAFSMRCISSPNTSACTTNPQYPATDTDSVHSGLFLQTSVLRWWLPMKSPTHSAMYWTRCGSSPVSS